MIRPSEQPDRIPDAPRIETRCVLVHHSDGPQSRSGDHPLPLGAGIAEERISGRSDLDPSSSPDLENTVHAFAASGTSSRRRRVAHDLLDVHAPSLAAPDIFGRRFEAVRAQADSDGIHPARRKNAADRFQMAHHLAVALDVADRVDRAKSKPDRPGPDPRTEVVEPAPPHARAVFRQTGARETHHRGIDIKSQALPPRIRKPLEIPPRATGRFENRAGRSFGDTAPDRGERPHFEWRARLVQDVVDERVLIEPVTGPRRRAGTLGYQ